MAGPLQSVLLVGGGPAMLPVIRHLRQRIPDSVQISLVSEHPFHYFSGMMPEYLGGVYREEEVRLDLESLCERHGIGWELGRVVSIDAKRTEVTLEDGRVLGGDVLAFDVGTVTPGASDDRIHTAARPAHAVRRLAEQLEDMTAARSKGAIAILGAEAVGVEMALNIGSRLRRLGLARSIRVHLFGQGDRVLPSLPPKLSEDALRLLLAAGVRVGLNARPTVRGDLVSHGPDEERYDAVVWATEAVAPTLFKEAGFLTDGRGFVHTDPELRVLGRDVIFVAGETALVRGCENVARVEAHAIRQGPVLLENLVSAVLGKTPSGRFRPPPISPIILSTGGPTAWWLAGPVWFRTKWALRYKHYADRTWMNPWLDPAFRRRDVWDVANAGDPS